MTGSTVLPKIKMTWFNGVDYTIIHQFLKSSKVHVLSMFKLLQAQARGILIDCVTITRKLNKNPNSI